MSDNEALNVFLGIVCIICAILGIVLFFKIWWMTDDVKKLKKRFSIDDDFLNSLRRAYLKGNLYEVHDILSNDLVDRLLARRYDKDDNEWEVEMGYNYVEKVIKDREFIYEKVGFEIPENILKLKDDPTDIFLTK